MFLLSIITFLVQMSSWVTRKTFIGYSEAVVIVPSVQKFTSFVSSSFSLSLSKASPCVYSITIAFALLNLARSIYARVDPGFFSFFGYGFISTFTSSSSLMDSPLWELNSLSSSPSSSLVLLLANSFLFFFISAFF